jgi:internalin A
MSELALKLIAENKKTRSTFLDLGNCGLRVVPPEISDLVWLEELSFASEWLYFDNNHWC